MLYSTFYITTLGVMRMESDGKSLTGLLFSDDSNGIYKPDHPVFDATRCWLESYLGGGIPDFMPRLSLHGTPFQQTVWKKLLKIPYGETATYGGIARHINCRSAQAVGRAIHSNPIALIIPCHRVIGSDGSLKGYAYGIETKRKLLEMEKERLCRQFMYQR